ncbi:probable palmitoyltransferase ZDHHC14 [Contarinia nasturtii]|uniref:probable palmitoyltransferase ZDHHC14 n=1 Tax=Contarinia nasturtii TaxID=265458 RepID=UPI0012D3D8A8|nr:probable palmitoyltransferase ZDHHC14 [Contarinia nasturtii]XP_031620566.1 probable palmitoyltransferase ZDHHC14 [Contarinia nasturtii]XP_031620567.1 probable palmitoyltransferase ZDHHC14 [Contarinia nasturtii]XP_031620568.1 probable palmitoyltransferase ZDHHC14 [Contarinia nasturtii]
MRLLYCCCCWRMAPNTRTTRKWEVFSGRNKFYCDGYLMSAPNTGIFYLTVFLISGTSALFFVYDCPYLTTNITSAIPIVGAILYVFTMSSLLRTTFTDPGVIPRALQDEAAYIEKQIEVPNSLNSPTYRPPPRTKEILVKGQTVKLKYCFTCKIFRPPRASHCSLCDNCVDRFDHHCPWVGNCVGKRNYRFFYMFIVSLAFLAVFIFSCSVTHLVLLGKGGNDEFIEIVKDHPFTVIVTLICFFSIWSVIGLAGFHTYLTTSDQTTNEDIKGSFSKGAQQIKNPYSHGNICSNCCFILCGPMAPSLIDRRGEVTEEYIVSDMQATDNNRFNGQQSIVLQPLSNNTHIQKTKYYDNEIDNNLISSNKPGKYRQRSYDNLKTGNSNSVANLVENENPTSMQSVAINDDMLPNMDTDTLGNLTPFNNMKGSYNNLFCDNLDDDTVQTFDQNDTTIMSPVKTAVVVAALATAGTTTPNVQTTNNNQMLENVYCNISPAMQTQTNGNETTISTANTINQSATNHIVDNILRMPSTDPNLHVYSNVSNECDPMVKIGTITAAVAVSANDILAVDTTTLPIKGDNLNADNTLHLNNIESIINQSIKSSKMLSDNLNDLDLDDPTLAIVNTPKTSSMAKIFKSNDTTGLNSGTNNNNKFNSNKRTKQSLSAATAVNSDDARLNVSKKLFNDTTISTDMIGDTENGNGSYLRSLHDTTMIDTALDLDSIEDANISIENIS